MPAIQAQQGARGPGVTGVSGISWNIAPGWDARHIRSSLLARRAPSRAVEMEVSLPLCRSPLAFHVSRRAHPWNWAVLVEPETIPACRTEM